MGGVGGGELDPSLSVNVSGAGIAVRRLVIANRKRSTGRLSAWGIYPETTLL